MKKTFISIILALIMALVITACGDPENSNPNNNNSGNNNGNGSGNNGSNTPTTLAAFLTSLKETAQSGGNYTYEVKADETLAPQDLSYEGKNNITITLTGDSANRIVSLQMVYGSMFIIRSGVTLVLGNNITLQGHNANNAPLVIAHNGGTLIMNTGSKISDNTNTSSTGGGVVVSGGLGSSASGNFIMNGGEISGNRAFGGGGGVAVSAFCTFTMNNGKIINNSANSYGGGVLVYGSFTMEDGEISNNTLTGNPLHTIARQVLGGGVYVNQATFTMNGGKITGNTASDSFMFGVSSASGGGVYVNGITGYPAYFTMTGGEISGNSVSASLLFRGGGVQVGDSSTSSSTGTFFTKTGGIITGYTDDTVTGNVVKNNSGIVQSNQGHAVYVSSSRRRETTAGTSVNLDSSTSENWGN